MTTKTKVTKVETALKFHTNALVNIGGAIEPNLIDWIRAIAKDLAADLLSVRDAQSVIKAAAEQGVGFKQLKTSHAQYFVTMAALADLPSESAQTVAALYYAADQLTRAQVAGKGETKAGKAAEMVAAAKTKGVTVEAISKAAAAKNRKAAATRKPRPNSGKVETAQGLTVEMVQALRSLIVKLDSDSISDEMGEALNELAATISGKLEA